MAKAKKQRIEYSFAEKDWQRMTALIQSVTNSMTDAVKVASDASGFGSTLNSREYYLEMAISANPESTIDTDLSDDAFLVMENIRIYLEKVQAARRQAIS